MLNKFKQHLKLLITVIYDEYQKKNVKCKTPQSKYRKFCKKEKIEKNSILYESFAGRGMVCNPYAIFNSFMKQPDFYRYQHYWVIDDMEDNAPILSEYNSYQNVHFIKYKSDDYFYHLATAEFLINNVAFPGLFSVRDEQHYLNTWHGIPLKTLGFDIPGGNINSKNTLRNFLMCDYLSSPNPFMNEIYKNAFKLDHLFSGSILEEGQPRNDNLFHTSFSSITSKLSACGVHINTDKKIILYAPTWRGAEYNRPNTNLEEYFNFIHIMEKNIDTQKYQVLIKPHQIVYKYIKADHALTSQFVPAIIDTNELLSIVDILVSDFSSIFFDFLATNRPILFYIPDLEEYKKYRGLYNSTDFLPGPVADTMDKIPSWIQSLPDIVEKYKGKYETLKKWACPHDDGSVCTRLIDCFLNAPEQDSCVKNVSAKKTKLLLYGGKLENHDSTQSLLNLLKYINYNKFDITLLVEADESEKNKNIINSIEPTNVRVLTFLGPYNSDSVDDIRYRLIMDGLFSSPLYSKIFPHRFFTDEAKRILGKSIYDYTIDFVGSNLHYNMILLHASASKHFVWQHNDLSEQNLKTSSMLKTLLRNHDQVIYSNKKYLDPELSQIYMPTMIDEKRIENCLESDPFVTIENKEYFISDIHSSDNKEEDLYLFPLPSPDKIIFATMGRLLPEKNHQKLIEAFEILHKDFPNTFLYIIGDGPTKSTLQRKIKQLDLQQSVCLTNHLQNPFSLLKRCSCFILPSSKDRFPLSVMEMHALKIPIILTNFLSHEDVCIPNGQSIVSPTVDGLYNGMKSFIKNAPLPYNFDCTLYNESICKQFESLFD